MMYLVNEISKVERNFLDEQSTGEELPAIVLAGSSTPKGYPFQASGI